MKKKYGAKNFIAMMLLFLIIGVLNQPVMAQEKYLSESSPTSPILDYMAAVMSTIDNDGALATCEGGVVLDSIPGISAKVTMAMQESRDNGKTWRTVKSKSYPSTTATEFYSFKYYMTRGRHYRTLIEAYGSKNGVLGEPVQCFSQVLYY